MLAPVRARMAKLLGDANGERRGAVVRGAVNLTILKHLTNRATAGTAIGACAAALPDLVKRARAGANRREDRSIGDSFAEADVHRWLLNIAFTFLRQAQTFTHI